MKEYHKIQSLFFRDPAKNNKSFLEGQWSRPEFQYLATNIWLFEEKVDGTNVRVGLENNAVRFYGRTKDAQMPTYLYAKLQEMFQIEKIAEVFPEGEFELYGEGYGAKIQKGGGDYIQNGCSFILFDVRVGDWWLKREDVRDVAEKLGLKTAPTIGQGTLLEAIELCKNGFKSALRETSPEGLILRPEVELFSRNGERIISKLKLKDFKTIN